MLPDLFYQINFSISIFLCTIGFIFGIITIFLVVLNRPYRSLNNILSCNTSIGAIFYCLITLSTSILGIRKDWSINAPFCSYRAFCYNVSIALVCHSKSIHAISRLFFAVFYKHRYLLTWRCHRMLILISWLICIIICIPPFFVKDGYSFEQQSRCCVISSENYLLALYITMVSCLIPFHIIVIIYSWILYSVRQSTRRVWAFNPNIHQIHSHIPRNKRQMKLMKEMIIQTGILISGGPIFLVLIIWHTTTSQPPPEWLYLLAFNSLTIVGSTAPLVQLMMNKQLINHYFKRDQQMIHLNHRLQQPRHLP